jgi:N-methylhydantoinase B
VTADSGLMNILTLHGRLADGSPMSATYFASGGFGAMSGQDGRATTPGSSNMGSTPIEIFEPQTGLVVESKTLRVDSGGAGTFRGGAGQDVLLRNDTGHPMTIFSMANRTRFPARGLAGGQPGAARAHLVNGVPIATQGRHELAPGDRLLLREAGGGGFGPPAVRSPDAVRQDVAAGLVSAAAALRDHGVPME